MWICLHCFDDQFGFFLTYNRVACKFASFGIDRKGFSQFTSVYHDNGYPRSTY